MATQAVSPAVSTQHVNLDKTQDCVYVTTTFTMGIGRLRQTRHLEVTTTADKSRLRHQKQLIDSPELDEIRSQDGYMRRHIDSVTAYADSSTRFLTTAGTHATKLYKAMEAYRTLRRPALVEKFMSVYRALEAVDFAPVAEALGDQFNRKDYPASDVVEAGFAFTFRLTPVGDISALKGLPDFIIALEVEKERASRAAVVLEWKATMREAFASVVDVLFEAVKQQPDGKKKTLRDATVTNVLDFIQSAPIRDLANDVEAQAELANVAQLLDGVTPERLRHNDSLKAHLATQLAGVRKNLAHLVDESGRKFR
jgi:hypothetical protein